MFKWREESPWGYCVHRDRNNVTSYMVSVDLPKYEQRNRSREVIWFRLEDGEWWPVGFRDAGTVLNPTLGMPPLKFRRRYRAKWVGDKRFNPARLQRNLTNMGKVILGLGIWCLFWWLFGRGMSGG